MSRAGIEMQLELARVRNGDVARVHAFAMAAKECIFSAQDAASLAWSAGEPGPKRRALLKKLDRRLAKVRRELEELDNDWLAVAREVTL